MEVIKNSSPVFSIVKGVLISVVFTAIMLTFFAGLLVYTNLSEDTITPVIITVTGISILVGSSMGVRNLKKNGLINGAIIGIIYILIIYLISSGINSNFKLGIESILMIVIAMICGIIGGIIGINTRFKELTVENCTKKNS